MNKIFQHSLQSTDKVALEEVQAYSAFKKLPNRFHTQAYSWLDSPKVPH